MILILILPLFYKRSLSDSIIHDAQFRMSCHQDSGIAGTTLTGETADSETAEDHCVCGKTVACIGSPTLSVKQVKILSPYCDVNRW